MAMSERAAFPCARNPATTPFGTGGIWVSARSTARRERSIEIRSNETWLKVDRSRSTFSFSPAVRRKRATENTAMRTGTIHVHRKPNGFMEILPGRRSPISCSFFRKGESRGSGASPSSGKPLGHDPVVDDRAEFPDAVIGSDGVYPVGQKDYDIHAFPVDPDRCPGIPEMTDRIRRKEIPG
jgi:hypothetical protein